MEILFGYILYLLPLFIILYVMYSLSLIKSKLDTVMNYLEINEYAEEVVSDEEIEKVLEEEMEKE